MGMKTSCLGAHSGSSNKTLVARTRNLGASGDRAPVRQQPCYCDHVSSGITPRPIQEMSSALL